MSNLIACDWFREHLLGDTLPRWLRLSVSGSGFFMPGFDRRWNRTRRQVATLVTQSRLLYNFAQGYELTGEKPYRRAVEVGARFLMDRFRDREFGGWVWSCASDGTALDSRKDSYGHAFVIFGLSHAYQATETEDYKEAALDTWRVLESKFRDRYGGLAWKMTRDFRDCDSVREQGPLMHLFEALLALAAASEENVLEQAEELAEFVFRRLFRRDEGILPESYSLDWKEPAEDACVYIGHAFEWAYLLSRGVEMGLPTSYLGPAAALLDYGLTVGWDARNGGFHTTASLDGAVTSERKVWWTQCEAIRALLHFAVLRGRDDLREILPKTIAFVHREFIDPDYGGWYEYRDPGLEPAEQDKGHMGESDHPVAGLCKVDYHVVGMCVEALRLSSRTAAAS